MKDDMQPLAHALDGFDQWIPEGRRPDIWSPKNSMANKYMNKYMKAAKYTKAVFKGIEDEFENETTLNLVIEYVTVLPFFPKCTPKTIALAMFFF